MKTITLEEYEKLKGIDRIDWQPVYAGYKIKKERSYSECDCCGHREFVGWVERSYPIGKPLHYELIKANMMERLNYQLLQHYADKLLATNTFNPKTDGETVKINFTRYTNV